MQEIPILKNLPPKHTVLSLDRALDRLADTLSGRLAGGAERFGRVMGKVSRDLKNQLRGFDELHLLEGPEPPKPPKPEKPPKPPAQKRPASGKTTLSTKALTKALREAAAAVRSLCEAIEDIPNRVLPLLFAGLTALLPVLTLLAAALAGLFAPAQTGLSRLSALLAQLSAGWAGFLETVVGGLLAAWPCFLQLDQWIKALWPLLSGLLETVLTPFFALLKEQLSALWQQLSLCWQQFSQSLLSVGELLCDLWENHAAPFLENLQGLFAPAVQWVGQVVGALCFGTGALVQNLTAGLVRMLDGLRMFLASVFCRDWAHAWRGIGEIFGGAWDMIVGGLKASVNTVVDLVNLMLRAVAKAVNAVADSINSISVTIPAWVPLYGGRKFSPNVPRMPEYQLPRLAKGAVLPANRPFLAMVGDQKHGTNIEAPLETIQQAVRQVLAQGAAQSFTADAPIEVRLDGEVLYRAMSRIRLDRGMKIGGAFGECY